MKRFIIACTVALLCAATAIVSSVSLGRQAERLSRALTDALEAAESGDNLLAEKTAYVLKIWKDTSTEMHILLLHSDINEVEASILSLDDYLRERNMELYREACVRGINQLKSISQANIPNWDNIL